MKSIKDSYVLSNGYKIPCLGFGTWRLTEADSTVDTIKTAIDCGYRHIDTAFSYYNEKSVGKAIRTSGLKRSDLFVTTKLSNGSNGYEETMAEFDMSMNNLDIDYVDLYLIHWPRPLPVRDTWKEHNEGSWKAFEELYKAGKIKAIGVSNFLDTHLHVLLETATITPMVNQLELHPRYVQREVVQYCKDRKMIVEAWSPLIRGELDNPLLLNIAKKHNKSVAQILLAWSIQHGFLPLPKASSKERMMENAHIFDFKLSEGDIEAMKALEALGKTGAHPDTADF